MQNKTNKKKEKAMKPKVKPEDMKTLIIVDAQNDFCNPDGALYVNGAEHLPSKILEFVNKNKDKINQIIFTRDWHQKKDKSFKDNGGTWPVHCVQNTEGAAINKKLYDTLVQSKIQVNVVNKGTVFDHEEYGAFEHCATFHHLYPNDKPIVQHCYFANIESSSGSRIINENIIVCGVAGDYCVKETIKNLKKHWRNFNIELFMDGIASIDDGSTLLEFATENNLKMI